jgi:putative hydroxymethylpyrimidine transport system substrate-binding protein
MRQGVVFVALIVAAAFASGCGGDRVAENTESTAAPMREVKVTLDGSLSPANAAVQVAIREGYFADVGLVVSVATPLAPRRPVTYVSNSTDDIGLTQEPQLALAKEKGAPLVAVGSLISQPTAAMIWLKKSKIRGIADLAGKTIAVPGIPYQEDLLESVLGRAGLEVGDVDVRHAPYELVPTLLEGKADAIFGGSWNIEGIALRERGAKPVIRRVQELGIPPYGELVVIARSDWATKESTTIRNFMAALSRATALISKDPEAAVEAIEEITVATPRAELEAQAKATAPLLSTGG